VARVVKVVQYIENIQ